MAEAQKSQKHQQISSSDLLLLLWLETVNSFLFLQTTSRYIMRSFVNLIILGPRWSYNSTCLAPCCTLNTASGC